MAPLAPYAHLHENPQGEGDARPTALQIVKDQGLEGKLTGKTILITGGASGIGVETTRALYATGASIFIAVRDTVKGTEVAKSLATDPSRPIEVIEISLDSFASVRAGAAAFLKKTDKLNVFVANAGVMACPYGKTADGFETQFGTNHLGHFLLFHHLKPALLAGAASSPDFASRVIVVSSSGHRMVKDGIRFTDYNFEEPDSYDVWQAYGQSKLANVYFANEIDRKYGTEGIHALSLHPGSITTPLQRHIADNEWAQAIRNSPAYVAVRKSTEQGAATTVWAAIAKEWEGKGGKHLDNVQESVPVQEGANAGMGGYAPLAYNPEGEARLWADSLRMCGLN